MSKTDRYWTVQNILTLIAGVLALIGGGLGADYHRETVNEIKQERNEAMFDDKTGYWEIRAKSCEAELERN